MIYPKECSYNRWLKKDVINKKVIFDGSKCDLSTIEKIGIDKLHFELEKGENGLSIKYNSKISEHIKRPVIGLKINFPEEDYSEYNRVRVDLRVNVKGIQNLYMHFCVQGDEKYFMHAPSIITNKWVTTLFELNQFDRSKLSFIKVIPFIGGCPPYSNGNFEVIIKKITFEKVKEEYELGYNLEDRIAYSHFGYYPKSKKTFIVSGYDLDYEIVENSVVVKRGKTVKLETVLGTFGIGDFSDIEKVGKYKITCDGKETEEFLISFNPYKEGIDKSLSFLYQLRCGTDVEGVHEACHLNSYTTNELGDKVPNFGGWHDAGDLSQFEICTALMTSCLLELYQSNKNKRVLEEAKVGLNWLLQTTFHNGDRALSVSYDKWYDNVRKASDVYPNNKSESGPFENFLSSAALALGAIVYKEIDEVYSDWCLNIAMEDYHFGITGYKEGKYTKRWGPSPIPQVLGASLTAASLLYKLTGDEKYILDATENAKMVMACQERNYVGANIKVRGFFYEDLKHENLLIYEHRGHESTPVCGLVDLCNAFPYHKDYPKWIESIKLYKEYIETLKDISLPYGLLAGHIYKVDKVDFNKFTIPSNYGPRDVAISELKEQIVNGLNIGDDWYVRRMPIAIQRRGFHATLLSKTKAVSSVAKLLKDEDLRQIAIDQLEWIVGKNPFATSTIYGAGNNYHPLYVAYSRQLIGAMPVGFETHGVTDEPYWPARCNAVFKEVWGHTTGYYLGVIADLKW